MPVSASFREWLLDQLRPLVPTVRVRSMFGGLGVYAGELFFAVVADDRVYLKANASTVPKFEAIGMEPFRPFGDDRMVMSYYEIPLEVIEQVERLRPWVEEAITVARQGQSAKKSSRSGKKAASTRAKKTAIKKATRKKREQ